MVIQIREEQNKAVDSSMFIVLNVNLFMLLPNRDTDIGIEVFNWNLDVISASGLMIVSFSRLKNYLSLVHWPS